MTYYCILLFFYTICAAINKPAHNRKKQNIIILILLIPIFYLIGFRSDSVGSDTFSYHYIYENMKHYSTVLEPLTISWMETGYVTVIYYLSHIGLTYYSFQLIVALFFLISYYRFISSYSLNVGMSCFLIVASQSMFGMMNQTRMWIAIAILLFAIKPLQEKKLLLFCLIILLASMFHLSSIIVLIAYPISIWIKKNGNRVIFITILSSCVVAVLGNRFLAVITNLIGFYSNYLKGGSTIAAVLFFLIYGIIFVLVYRIETRQFGLTGVLDPYSYEDKTVNNGLAPNIAITFSLMTFAFSIIGLANSFVTRVESYFGITLVVILANELEKIHLDSNRRIIKLFFVLLYILLFFVILKYRPNWDKAVPYEFIWS